MPVAMISGNSLRSRSHAVSVINNRGQLVGSYTDNTGLHGFLFSNGTFAEIIPPGTLAFSIPFGIDDRGRIVGAN
jgi:probable HAF family extracellular repeat protein